MKLSLRAEHTIYKNKAGKRVPGVTSTQGVFAKPFLYPWYAEMEREGIYAVLRDNWGPGLDMLWELLPTNKDGEPQWFANIKRDAAADLGKVAHAHIEAHNKNDFLERDGIPDEMYDQGAKLAERYLMRIKSEGFACKFAEHVMVDEDLQVGGTGDQFGQVNGEWWYRDLKTSKPWYKGKPYAENIAQAAAYAMMFEKQQGVEVKHVAIDRIGKTLDDPGDFWVLTPEQRAVGERRFKLGVQAYYCDRDMEDAIRVVAKMAG